MRLTRCILFGQQRIFPASNRSSLLHSPKSFGTFMRFSERQSSNLFLINQFLRYSSKHKHIIWYDHRQTLYLMMLVYENIKSQNVRHKIAMCQLVSIIVSIHRTRDLSHYIWYPFHFILFLFLLLAMISYNVVVGDTLSKVLIRFLPEWDLSMSTVRFTVVLVVNICVVIPLCLYRNVSRLAKASFISLACVVFILFAVILKLISGDYDVV